MGEPDLFLVKYGGFGQAYVLAANYAEAEKKFHDDFTQLHPHSDAADIISIQQLAGRIIR